MKAFVIHVHGVPVPRDDTAGSIEKPTQLDANAPTTFVFAFLANLLLAASFPDGKQQLNRVSVNHCEETRFSHQQVTPILMCFQ